MNYFSQDAVRRHFRRHHPGCPGFAVEYFANQITQRNWGGAPLGQAVGISLQTFHRHEMTDYDTLLLSGLDRKEARRRVQPRIDAMLGQWRTKAKAAKPNHAREVDNV